MHLSTAFARVIEWLVHFDRAAHRFYIASRKTSWTAQLNTPGKKTEQLFAPNSKASMLQKQACDQQSEWTAGRSGYYLTPSSSFHVYSILPADLLSLPSLS